MTEGDGELAIALGKLHREMSAIYAQVARDVDLTWQQVELLCQLNGDSPSFGELARALGCDKSNITGMVDRLSRRTLVRREVDPHDRRVVRLTLTERGVALGEEIQSGINELVGRRLAGLSAEGRAQLIALSEVSPRQ
ncbi:MarR family winged helix-turn-helix transcriptional regulator [Mycobacterium kyogaense]|uniref:MarR family winged helix-turn-helix transcriptional regulator n=1 Tax=Mycobacterium kyogaense TaxID=2212479 RepID=UPI000DAC7478|nr:MarR family transcriptional regulator [Mycobacterium kyogaense]